MMDSYIESRKNISSPALLQGQVVLITGASRGIGAATALLLARHGAAVGVNYHQSAERARAVVEAIQASGGRAMAIQASVDDAQEVGAMVQQVEQELGQLIRWFSTPSLAAGPTARRRLAVYQPSTRFSTLPGSSTRMARCVYWPESMYQHASLLP